MTAFKTEPDYLATYHGTRDGDVFRIEGGAPASEALSVEAVRVDAAGRVRHIGCPPGMDCSIERPAAGFLASAYILGALRAGRLHGTLPTASYGSRVVVCVPGEWIGIARPILDPCFDELSGAVLAQRHRLTGRFDGPSLDPVSIRVWVPSRRPESSGRNLRS